MKYKAYKLSFTAPVHFGNGTLESAGYELYADTIFSALCCEMAAMGMKVDELVEAVREDRFLITDAFPYSGQTYYIPKPMAAIKTENDGNSVLKKAFKGLKYIDVNKMKEFLDGKYDVMNSVDVEDLGVRNIKVSASVRGEEETKPYRVGTWSFHKDNGLYVIIGYADNQILELAETLFEALSYSGIGGKRSSGLGRFELKTCVLPENFIKRLESDSSAYMTLSVSLPKEEEIDAALDESRYLLIKRSGFVQSDEFSDRQLRKNDLFMLKSGSLVKNRFEGDIYEISGNRGKHKVYRYARPLFMGVENG